VAVSFIGGENWSTSHHSKNNVVDNEIGHHMGLKIIY
jgi:hypothetical protein